MQYGYVAEEFINSHKDSQPFGSPNPKHYWSVASLGPDRMGNWGVWSAIYGIDGIDFLPPILGVRWGCIYDPTNGTVSGGDIVKVSAERVTKAQDWQNY